MGKINTTFKYWLEIFKEAFIAAAKSLDIRGNIVIGIIWLFILFSLSWLASGHLILKYPSLLNWVSMLQGDLRGELRLAVMLIIVLNVLVVINIFYLPAKIHIEQNERIEYYEKRHENPKIFAEAYEEEMRLGIKLINEENTTIYNTRIDVIEIDKIDSLPNPLSLAELDFSQRPNFHIDTNSWKTVFLAQMTSLYVVFIGHGNKSYQFRPGELRIKTQINCSIDKIPIKPIINSWKVIFNPEELVFCLEKIK